MTKFKYWLFCNNEKIISYDYIEKKDFQYVLSDICQYFALNEVEIIKETKEYLTFNATRFGYKDTYKIQLHTLS